MNQVLSFFHANPAAGYILGFIAVFFVAKDVSVYYQDQDRRQKEALKNDKQEQ